MSDNKLTPKEAVEWLRVQQAEIKRTKALLERMEKILKRLIKNTQARGSKKAA